MRILWIVVILHSLCINSMKALEEKEIPNCVPVFTQASLDTIQRHFTHWSYAIEEQQEQTEKYRSQLGEEYSNKINKMLEIRAKEVSDFSSMLPTNLSNLNSLSALSRLLDKLLLHRIEWIRLRKGVVDQSKAAKMGYVELTPRTEERIDEYENFLDYSKISYNANMVKSICFHQTIKATFDLCVKLLGGDPRKLGANIKHKICSQPSLFDYLQGTGNNPWALDFTLGLDAYKNKQYHPEPDWIFIAYYYVPTIKEEVTFYSCMGKGRNKEEVIKTPFEAGYPFHKNLPIPEFLAVKSVETPKKIGNILAPEVKKEPETKPEKIPETHFKSSQEEICNSEPQKEAVPEVFLSQTHGNDQKNQETGVLIQPNNRGEEQGELDEYLKEDSVVTPQKFKKDKESKKNLLTPSKAVKTTMTSRFLKVQNWLEDTLFNAQKKVIKSQEWENNLKKIDGVTINKNSGSSHFEVLLDGKVKGGYFRTHTEYSLGYKKWLQRIILELGYTPEKNQ